MSTSRVPLALRVMGYPKGHESQRRQVGRQRRGALREVAGRSRQHTGGTSRLRRVRILRRQRRRVRNPVRRAARRAARCSSSVGDGRAAQRARVGDGAPELVLIHGGAQNAHTWDTVALALGRPLVAVDLPGHGHSDGVAVEPGHRGRGLARDVAVAIERLAPGRRGRRRDVARRADVDRARRPAARSRPQTRPRRHHARGQPREGQGHRRLRARAEDVPELRGAARPHDRAQPDPHRVVAAPRHPAQRGAARRRLVDVALPAARRPDGDDSEIDAGSRLWDTLGAVTMPVMLARGMRPQSVVDDADETSSAGSPRPGRALRRGGHSIQGDMPVELAASLAAFAADRR